LGELTKIEFQQICDALFAGYLDVDTCCKTAVKRALSAIAQITADLAQPYVPRYYDPNDVNDGRT